MSDDPAALRLDVAGRLALARERAGVSMQVVAKVCCVNVSTVSRWEAGATVPGPKHRRALGLVLCHPRELLRPGPVSPHTKHATMPDREAIRRHLIAEHHWPEVARYNATEQDLRGLHDLLHDPSRRDERLAGIRGWGCRQRTSPSTPSVSCLTRRMATVVVAIRRMSANNGNQQRI